MGGIYSHETVAGFHGADAASDFGPVHRTPALKQNARCSAERGDPAATISHPGANETRRTRSVVTRLMVGVSAPKACTVISEIQQNSK